MGKILLLAIAVWLLYIVLKRYRTSFDKGPPSTGKPEDMVQCAACGLHLPRSDSLYKEQHYYCCKAHADQPRA